MKGLINSWLPRDRAPSRRAAAVGARTGPISHRRLNLVLDHMRQRRLEHLPRVVRFPPPPSPGSTSTARRHGRTRCSRFAFIRRAETAHTWPFVAISAYLPFRQRPPETGP